MECSLVHISGLFLKKQKQKLIFEKKTCKLTDLNIYYGRKTSCGGTILKLTGALKKGQFTKKKIK